MSILTAQTTHVAIGILEIEGMMREDGVFGIAVPQIALLFPYFKADINNASILLKRLMGKEFKPDKVKSQFNRNATSFIDLNRFLSVLKALGKKQDPVALNMIGALLGLSLQQLFSDAFGIKFEKEERQQWLVQRQTHRDNFHPLYTAWLKKDGVTTTYGTEVNRLKLVAGTPLMFVGEYSYAQLAQLNRAEAAYHALRIAGLSHTKTLEILSISK